MMFTGCLPERDSCFLWEVFAGLVGSEKVVGGFHVALFRALVIEYHSPHRGRREKAFGNRIMAPRCGGMRSNGTRLKAAIQDHAHNPVGNEERELV